MGWIAVIALTVVATVAAWAAPVDGKWTWKQMRQQNEITMTLELKQDGEKLTGSLMQQGSEQKSEIKEGTIKGDELSFVVVRQFQDQEFKIAYKGKLAGDKITGSTTINFNGQDRTREWAADRVK
jgi:hypothetical protein